MNGEVGEASKLFHEGDGPLYRPLQFILYTNMGQSKNENRTVVKYADDTVIVSLLQNNENVSWN